MDTIIYQHHDFQFFRNWINLNETDITWQGKFKEEFNDFWESFFLEGLSLRQVVQRLSFAIYKVHNGPLQSWFQWVKEKFICFSFLYKDLTIEAFSLQTNMSTQEVSYILRSFFTEIFPQHYDYFNERFQVGNLLSQNVNVSYKNIKNDLKINSNIHLNADDIMSSMEITLYKEWNDFFKDFQKTFFNKKIDFSDLMDKNSLKKNLKYLIDFSVVVILGLLIMQLTKNSNVWYEKYLVDKISIFEPNFDWIDKSLTFKDTSEQNYNTNDNIKDLDSITKKVDLDAVSQEEEIRYQTETDVSFTSLDTLPRDIEAAEAEKSQYDDDTKGTFRDNLYGENLTYRILIQTIDSPGTSGSLDKLFAKYDAKQISKQNGAVRVPGGLYYNVFLPIKYSKEFLAQAMSSYKAKLFVNRSTTKGTPGMTKIFVWIKEL